MDVRVRGVGLGTESCASRVRPCVCCVCRRGHSASRRSGLGATDGDAIPGLDGFGAIEPWLSSAALRRADRIRPYTFMVLIAILIGVPDVAESLFGIADRFAGAQDLPGEVWASYALSQFEFWN
jgi:hypothetical protein